MSEPTELDKAIEYLYQCKDKLNVSDLTLDAINMLLKRVKELEEQIQKPIQNVRIAGKHGMFSYVELEAMINGLKLGYSTGQERIEQLQSKLATAERERDEFKIRPVPLAFTFCPRCGEQMNPAKQDELPQQSADIQKMVEYLQERLSRFEEMDKLRPREYVHEIAELSELLATETANKYKNP